MKFQFTKAGLKIFPSKIEHHNIVTSGLKKAGNIQFFTHRPEHEKDKHLVIKGLPNLCARKIEEDLRVQGYEPLKCVQLKLKKPVPPIYMVTFNKDTDINEVRNIRYVCSIKIFWDKYRSGRVTTQCHRCQQFGHGSSSCNQAPRCVKCSKSHLTKDCDREKDAKPVCVNCKGEHPANYSKCPSNLKRVEEIEEQRSKKLPAKKEFLQKLVQKKIFRRQDGKKQLAKNHNQSPKIQANLVICKLSKNRW